ncbi:UTRA domain-containing protein [Actinocorallia sp. API 0066]|uniref:UTRA domain-containing protein n=1 Tax=Actinocorallia sp. API 0066 TaxID=2896846 RepID=UPI0035ABF87C
MSTRIPTPTEYQALNLPSDLPVLHTFRVVYSHNNRPIEATTMIKPGHLTELHYKLTP